MDRNAISVNTYDRCAVTYQEKFKAMETYNDTYDRFCALVDNPSARLLDVSCGPGNISSYLLKKHPTCQITGIDLSPNMVALAEATNPSATYYVFDCRDISQLKEKFDGLLCGFGFPYLSKEECAQFIQDAAGVLNDGGILYLSTMEDDYAKSGFETTSFSGDNQVYIYYHQFDFLEKELRQNGFHLKEIFRKEYAELDGTFSIDLILIAQLSTQYS